MHIKVFPEFVLHQSWPGTRQGDAQGGGEQGFGGNNGPSGGPGQAPSSDRHRSQNGPLRLNGNQDGHDDQSGRQPGQGPQNGRPEVTVATDQMDPGGDRQRQGGPPDSQGGSLLAQAPSLLRSGVQCELKYTCLGSKEDNVPHRELGGLSTNTACEPVNAGR
ncbi:hypothetical protein ARMGADRAFT_1040136 [Armillaria gallica]|uniref:Uncharacterized protein n=1 Tax=Armillaria gallica TaxID=47427 RepID=A0A2H3CG51_ARMGA|nr:hypothetical protein ARMGADRAFT_1040136 [Armillaria gallica]